MARQSMYIHGNSVVMEFPGGKGDPVGSPHTPTHQMNGVFDAEGHIEWSDVVGLRRPGGVTFRGRAGQNNRFYACVPTPSWRDNVRATLARVAVKFKADPGVNIIGMLVTDGADVVPFPFPPLVLGADHSRSWDVNVNFFDTDHPPAILSGVAVVFDVSFATEGDITFCCVGCDFIV